MVFSISTCCLLIFQPCCLLVHSIPSSSVVWSIADLSPVGSNSIDLVICVSCRYLTRVRLVSSPSFFSYFCTVLVIMCGLVVNVSENLPSASVVFVAWFPPFLRLCCCFASRAGLLDCFVTMFPHGWLFIFFGHVRCRVYALSLSDVLVLLVHRVHLRLVYGPSFQLYSDIHLDVLCALDVLLPRL